MYSGNLGKAIWGGRKCNFNLVKALIPLPVLYILDKEVIESLHDLVPSHAPHALSYYCQASVGFISLQKHAQARSRCHICCPLTRESGDRIIVLILRTGLLEFELRAANPRCI